MLYEEKILLTITEVAEILRIGKRTIYNQMHKGEFPIKKFRSNKPIRFKRSDVINYINGEDN